jgi:hypothetical protein
MWIKLRSSCFDIVRVLPYLRPCGDIIYLSLLGSSFTQTSTRRATITRGLEYHCLPKHLTDFQRSLQVSGQRHAIRPIVVSIREGFAAALLFCTPQIDPDPVRKTGLSGQSIRRHLATQLASLPCFLLALWHRTIKVSNRNYCILPIPLSNACDAEGG